MLEHLSMFSWNGIDVIKKLQLCPFGWHRCNFLIKKITSMSFQENTRRTQGDALPFLNKSYWIYIYIYIYIFIYCATLITNDISASYSITFLVFDLNNLYHFKNIFHSETDIIFYEYDIKVWGNYLFPP
jgi:hypothetical protein